MNKRERVGYLKIRGWRRLSARGPQLWIQPDRESWRHFTLAGAIREQLASEEHE